MNLTKSQMGQISIEMVLILIVLIAITVTVADQFRQNQVIAQLVSGPWRSLDGMVQAGIWAPADEAIKKHPNLLIRHQTPDPSDNKNMPEY